MIAKMLSGAGLATMLTVAGAQGESLAQLGGPANPPPSSFKGQQFVDSRGCLFLRGGSGAHLNWVARVDRNHKPICGMPPNGAAAQAALAADMVPDPLAVPQIAPHIQVATAARVVVPAGTSKTTAAAQSSLGSQNGSRIRFGQLFGFGAAPVQPRPDPTPTVFSSAASPTAQSVQPQSQGIAPLQTAAQPYQGAEVASSVEGVPCYADAPTLERVKVAGGTALVCTRGDGSVNGWRPPKVANARQAQIAAQTARPVTAPVAVVQVAAPMPVQSAPVQTASAKTAPVQSAPVQIATVQIAVPAAAAQQSAARSHALPKPPKGWAYAWTDDRLNPLRGIGTAEGQTQQDLIWTRTLPMVLVTDVAQRRTVAQVPRLRTTGSTMSANPQKPAAQRAAPVAQQAGPVTAAARSSPPAGSGPAGSGALLVQVGCFGDAANAQGTANRLSALGLPVSTAAVTRKGKALQIVYAGPFASPKEAQAGLATLHGAGFGGAFLR